MSKGDQLKGTVLALSYKDELRQGGGVKKQGGICCSRRRTPNTPRVRGPFLDQCNFLNLCAPSLREGHPHIVCIAPIWSYDLRGILGILPYI